jgi:hypothetical protein
MPRPKLSCCGGKVESMPVMLAKTVLKAKDPPEDAAQAAADPVAESRRNVQSALHELMQIAGQEVYVETVFECLSSTLGAEDARRECLRFGKREINPRRRGPKEANDVPALIAMGAHVAASLSCFKAAHNAVEHVTARQSHDAAARRLYRKFKANEPEFLAWGRLWKPLNVLFNTLGPDLYYEVWPSTEDSVEIIKQKSRRFTDVVAEIGEKSPATAREFYSQMGDAISCYIEALTHKMARK